MKRCPKCHQVFREEALKFCRADGTPLVTASLSEAATIQFPTQRELLPETTPSLAVLPFSNLTADPANEYVCDGLAEGFVHVLSRIENLKVAGRTSSFSFKEKEVDVRQIGNALHVDTVLEGSVRTSGNRMRITVQLVNARNGFQLWTERFDLDVRDLLKVQNEITPALIDALHVKLRDQEQAIVFKQHTQNAKAHELYLQGRFHATRLTGDGFSTGVELLKSAIAEDPGYALAYAGLAEAHYFASSVHLRPAEALIQVKTAGEKALALDEDLAEAHMLVGMVAAYYDRKSEEAEVRFKRALELAPNSVLAHRWYGRFLMSQGRLAAAIGEFFRARELDPLSARLRALTSITYFFARQPYKALREARKAITIDQDFWFGYWTAALAHEQMGQLVEALNELEKARERNSSPWITAVRARVYARLGRSEIAEAVAAEASEKLETQWVAPYLIATVHFALDDKDRGFEWLEKAFAQYDESLNFMTVDPLLDAYRADPRFMDLLRRAGLEQSHAKNHVVVTVSGSLKSTDNYMRDSFLSSEARRIWV